MHYLFFWEQDDEVNTSSRTSWSTRSFLLLEPTSAHMNDGSFEGCLEFLHAPMKLNLCCRNVHLNSAGFAVDPPFLDEPSCLDSFFFKFHLHVESAHADSHPTGRQPIDLLESLADVLDLHPAKQTRQTRGSTKMWRYDVHNGIELSFVHASLGESFVTQCFTVLVKELRHEEGSVALRTGFLKVEAG